MWPRVLPPKKQLKFSGFTRARTGEQITCICQKPELIVASFRDQSPESNSGVFICFFFSFAALVANITKNASQKTFC